MDSRVGDLVILINFAHVSLSTLWEMQWPSGQYYRLSGPGLGEMLNNFHSASLHPGVQMGTSELSGKPDKMLEGNL